MTLWQNCHESKVVWKDVVVKNKNISVIPVKTAVLADIRGLIESSRGKAAAFVNAELTMMFWRVGERIRREILKEKRAEYGQQIVASLSRQLVADYGASFSEKNLRRIVQFAEVFSDEQIVVSLIRQLTWTHFIALIPIEDPLKREFYAEMCRMERWSVRTLRKKIDGMMFERTAIARKPGAVIKKELSTLRSEDQLTPDLVFRDPYFLDFLGLQGAFQEKDLEAAILKDLELFIMELGAGFTFVERQKRIVVDGEDFYLDLLFYHRGLRRLIAIELKLGKFKPDHKGQMELYLRWLDKYERKPGEDHPIGLILCAGKSDERVELLEIGKSGIRVAEYITELLPKGVLEKKFHESIRLARMRIENKADQS